MTELTPKGNLFDKSFEVSGRYMAQLKSGVKVCYAERGEIWKDKTACYWVTLELTKGEFDVSGLNSLDEVLYCFDGIDRSFDVRYNEISAIWEL